MLFKKKKEQPIENVTINDARLALTSLVSLCNDGIVKNDAFIIKDKDIYIYADVISVEDNVAQIIYQLHHAWLHEPIIESIAAAGTSLDDAVHQAAANFYENVLSLYLDALNPNKDAKRVRIMTLEPHDYVIYRGHMNTVGDREGALEGDFWDMLHDEIIQYLPNKKAHWIKIFTSKNHDHVVCEVRINNEEISALSERMIAYAEEWQCKDSYHSEKQGILLIQDQDSYVQYEYTKEEITTFTNKGIVMFEKCNNRNEYIAIRKKLYKITNDASLTHELFFLIPEFYCVFAYPQVEVTEKVFLIHKNEKTKELAGSLLTSYAYIKEAVQKHFANNDLPESTIERVLQYSANARAIQKAVNEGYPLEELMVPGIGIFIPKNYKIR